MRRVMTATAVSLLAGSVGVRGDDTATRWWSHVEALANDGMEGRDTGSPGHKRAAEYVATQFKKSGLEPAGVGGYIQPVAFKTRRIVEAKSSLSLVRSGAAQPLTLGEDANISMRVDDGFLITPTHFPGSFDDFGRAVVPHLQRLGVFRTDYTGTTLRDHLGIA